MAAHAHRLAPSDDWLSSKGPQLTRQVIESLRDGPKKPEDRAPSSLTKRINQCKVHPDSGLAILLQKSLWLWYIVILSDEIQAGVVEQLAGLTEADLDQVVCELDGHPWPQSITDSFSRTFYTSQRAKARQNALETSGFGRSIPEHLRINKRARFLQPDEPTETIQGFEEDLRIANSRFNINEATSSGDEIFDHSREAHRQGPARPECWPWLDASMLPYIFPPRTCEGVKRFEHSAGVTAAYGKVADEGQLFIYVGRDLAFRLARDFFAVDVTFDKETQSWAIRMPNGTDATGIKQCVFRKASVLPPTKLSDVLGTIISAGFENNRLRQEELRSGNALTRLLTLTLGTDEDILAIILDAEVLGGLRSRLWQGPTSSVLTHGTSI